MKTPLKSFLLVLGLGIIAGTFQTNAKSVNTEFQHTDSVNRYECRYGQCYATAKSTGRRCLHCVSNPGDLYCYQH